MPTYLMMHIYGNPISSACSATLIFFLTFLSCVLHNLWIFTKPRPPPFEVDIIIIIVIIIIIIIIIVIVIVIVIIIIPTI